MRLHILLFTLSSSTSLALTGSTTMGPFHPSVDTLLAADRHVGERVTRQRHLREEVKPEALNLEQLEAKIAEYVSIKNKHESELIALADSINIHPVNFLVALKEQNEEGISVADQYRELWRIKNGDTTPSRPHRF
uniref:RXLR effector n=1 Tax=Hyaloperonospora arabidopsidis TaxID=272952 RepID=F6MEZ2_HYAAB|nr:RXLR effector [Hyaloperonospora arabidopsidis]